MGDIGDWVESTFRAGGGSTSDKLMTLIDSFAQGTLPHDPGSVAVTNAASRFTTKTGLKSRTTYDDKVAAAQSESGARASADAAVRQAEYEEQAGMGAERTRAKRRRGFPSTILTGPGDTTGAAATGGKTLLGE